MTMTMTPREFQQELSSVVSGAVAYRERIEVERDPDDPTRIDVTITTPNAAIAKARAKAEWRNRGLPVTHDMDRLIETAVDFTISQITT